MEFRLGDLNTRFTFGFFTLLAVYFLLDQSGMGFPMLCGVAIHEAGHIAAMWRCGAKIQRMEFAFYGVRLEKRGLLSYRQEAAVYLGGVCANAITVLGCVLLGRTGFFAQVNLLLILFHLLPVGRLDGGALLRLAVSRAGYPEQAETVQLVVGILFLVPLFCAALWLCRGGNYTLFLTSCYLFAALLGRNER